MLAGVRNRRRQRLTLTTVRWRCQRQRQHLTRQFRPHHRNPIMRETDSVFHPGYDDAFELAERRRTPAHAMGPAIIPGCHQAADVPLAAIVVRRSFGMFQEINRLLRTLP